MTSSTRWISHSDARKHLEDSILLAYLRGQELEARPSVIQHIENEKCSVCLQKLNELRQVSTTLDILGEMRSYQYYPEVSVADIYACMQNAVSRQTPAKTAMNGAFYRQRPRKSAVRLISVPVAFGLVILFTMAMLVFAKFSGASFNPFSQTGGTSTIQPVTTMAVPPHTAATSEANVTATVTVTPGAKEPHMKVCSSQDNIAQMQLVICGFNFDSKHKAALDVYVPGKGSFLIRAIPIDKHGKFQLEWSVADCSNVPAFIYGYEVTSSKPIKVKLQITSFGSCPEPTTTPGDSSSGLPANYVP